MRVLVGCNGELAGAFSSGFLIHSSSVNGHRIEFAELLQTNLQDRDDRCRIEVVGTAADVYAGNSEFHIKAPETFVKPVLLNERFDNFLVAKHNLFNFWHSVHLFRVRC